MYKFDAEEAFGRLSLVSKPKPLMKSPTKSRSVSLPFVKSAINAEGCNGLEYNHGLFTQCCNARTGESVYCKKCNEECIKSEKGVPVTGTVNERMEKGLMEFRDPSGRKVVSYLHYLKKKNVSIEEANRLATEKNVDIEEHLVEGEGKRGRPKKEEAEEKSSSKGEKRGRPKKTPTKVESELVVDLFAVSVEEYLSSTASVSATGTATGTVSSSSSVSSLSEDDSKSINEVVEDKKEKKEKKVKKEKNNDEKNLKKAALEQEKAALKAAEKLAKEEAKAALEQEKAAKEQAKAALEAEKVAKKAALEAEKAAKEQAKAAALAAKEEAKASKKTTTKAASASAPVVPAVVVAAPVVEVAKEEERAKVKVAEFTFEGVVYWKSTDNLMYDPATKEVKGIWSETEKKMLPAPEESDDELSEEEYEEDEEED